MAYRAEIQIGVVGIGQLGALQKALNQVSNAVDVINKKQVSAGFNIQNINTYNAQLEKAWKNINKAALGSQEELQAVRNLVQAKNNQIAAQERLNRLIEREELMQRKIVATANAGFGEQGPALPPIPRGQQRGATSPIRGGRNYPGSPGAREAMFENLALGAGFPLLFGGGAGQVAGGLLGSFVGTGFGGQILGSAIGQILEDAQRRITEIGNATKTLNMDALRDSVLTVNNELEYQVSLLVQAGKADEARVAIAKQVTLQTGLVPNAVDDITRNVNVLGATWNEFLASVSGTLAIVGAPFVSALSLILQGLSKALLLVNLISSSILSGIARSIELVIGNWSELLTGLRTQKVLTEVINEEEQKRIFTLRQLTDVQLKEVMNTDKLLKLEAQRTAGRTIAEKEINATIDRQIQLNKIQLEYADKAKKLKEDYRNVTSEAGKRELELALQLNSAQEAQAVKQQNIKDLLTAQGIEIERNNEKYQQAADAVQRQRDALERSSAVTQSRLSAEAALNDLYGAQLQRQYELATTAQQRYNIAIKQFYQQVAAADIEYRQAKANNELLIQKAQLEYKLVEIKYQQIAAAKALGVAQAAERGNTPEQIQTIAAAYDRALNIQTEIIQASRDQISATVQIAKNQDQIAAAVYQTKLIQAESQLAQRLTSNEIGLSKQSADRLAGSLAVGVMQASKMQSALYGVSNAAATAATNIARATGQSYVVTQRTEKATATGNVMTAQYKYANGTTGYSYIKAHYAKGGYVNSPTVAMIGEGGQGEYVVPESKAAAFAMNYMLGARGAGAIDGNASPPAINITTGPVMQQGGQNYVTIQDMEAGLQAVADTILNNSRSYSARRFSGVS